jgi:hypothetical protein
MPCAKQFEKPESIPETAAGPAPYEYLRKYSTCYIFFQVSIIFYFIQLSDSV